MKKLKLSTSSQKFAICRLDRNEKLCDWMLTGDFFSITRTNEELSVVCSQANVPCHVKMDKDWRAFKVEGPLDFSLTGILSSLASPLANADISLFAVSTYDTDYLLVKSYSFEKASEVLGEICEIKSDNS